MLLPTFILAGLALLSTAIADDTTIATTVTEEVTATKQVTTTIGVSAPTTTSSSVATTSTVAADVFTASDAGFTFALNVPNDSDDLFFSIQATADGGWTAVGFGSDTMDKSLIFVAYGASDGKGVTISQRLGYGHDEPTYASNVTTIVLAGSGVANGTLTANIMCKDCRKWDGGQIDVTSKAQNMIFAYGPAVENGDDPRSDIKFHYVTGGFTVDMQAATGPGGVPLVAGPNSGAKEVRIGATRDLAPAIHACLMVFTFVGVFPFGVLLSRVMGWTRLHGVNQISGLILALIGMGCGIYAATTYNRTKKFNTPHQIFGFIIMVSLIAQPILGILHHRIYTQTKAPTNFAPVHVWLGRFVILGGIANAFAGFPLALSPRYNYVLLGLVLVIALPFTCVLWWKRKRGVRKAKEASAPPRSNSPKLFGENYQTWDTQHGNDVPLGNMGFGGNHPSGLHNQRAEAPWSGV